MSIVTSLKETLKLSRIGACFTIYVAAAKGYHRFLGVALSRMASCEWPRLLLGAVTAGLGLPAVPTHRKQRKGNRKQTKAESTAVLRRQVLSHFARLRLCGPGIRRAGRRVPAQHRNSRDAPLRWAVLFRAFFTIYTRAVWLQSQQGYFFRRFGSRRRRMERVFRAAHSSAGS